MTRGVAVALLPLFDQRSDHFFHRRVRVVEVVPLVVALPLARVRDLGRDLRAGGHVG